MEIKDIVLKLIGKVNPVGETNTDNERFENLKVLCELVDELVGIIDEVNYRNKDSHEFSRKRAARYASDFLTVCLGIK